MLDRDGNPVRATKFFHSGDHPTLRLRTREGFEVTGTHNHPVLCLEQVAGVPMLQWKLLDEIEPGTRVVISRHMEFDRGLPTQAELDAAFLAGAWVAEGFASTATRRASTTPTACTSTPWSTPSTVSIGGPRYVSARALPSGKTLHELDVQDTDAWSHSELAALTGLKSAEKRIPEFVWHAGLDVKQAFLQALFEGDGCVSYLGKNTVQITLLHAQRAARAATCRTCCSSSVSICRRAEYANGEIKLVIGNRRDANLFARRVGFWGAKQEKLEQILDALPGSALHQRRRPHPVPRRVRAGRERRPGRRQEVAREAQLRPHRRLGAPGPRDPGATSRRPRCSRSSPRWSSSGWYFATVESVTDAGVQPVFSIRVDSDDHAFLAAGFVNHNTESKLAPLAMQLLGEIDEDTVDFTPTYDGNTSEPVVLPGEISQPPGQRRRRDRRRYGDEHPAAQPRGGDRRGAAPHRPPRRVGHRPHAVREGPRLPARAR